MTILPEAKETLIWFAVLFILGLFIANRIVLIISFVPLFVYLFGISLPLPKIEAERTCSKNSAWVGETVDIETTVKITGGIGTVTLYEELPEHFELVDGSNYKVMWKGVGTKNIALSYKAKCTKRGRYYFKGTELEFKPILGLKPIKDVVGKPNELTVSPRIFDIRKVRIHHKMSSLLSPLGGITRLGAMSTDFKEIRQYTPGDSFKFINWKATARMSSGIKSLPLINEYEREGKLCVWIFLDAHQNMRFGTSTENAYEYGIEAAINFTHFFLNKGFLLAMYIYNDLQERFYPDIGKKQFIKISERLLKLYSIESGIQIHAVEGLPEAIEKNRKQLTSLSPLIIIITHLTQNNVKELIQGIKKVSWDAKRKHLAKTLIVNVLPYDLIHKKSCFEEFTARILEVKSKRLAQQFHMLGVDVLNWNPKKENFGSFLVKHLRLLLHEV
jgi:uncharacterized protein (DUF58 family)